ncbi:NADH-quinone oxidoreductase subunit N [Rhodohalobacter barkolensis]|uniref:NADH-quinone oxidoreductase subunit N n=1 Tax=Rhodohalobacter barkolensis TaxID=2053187 RepID=A0A2N0VL93_9BACT|nr:NADH-quinone oxidoreductase subunit N [Rhodohalobacter barkolensis]PKD44973.1 NADH-quinone oxidoreductase subunit N [Rhodohalobacter barkolensis]
MVDNILNSIIHFYPEIAIVVTLCGIIVADLFVKRKGHTGGVILFGGMVVTAVLLLVQTGWNNSVFYEMIAVDPFALYFKLLLTLATLFVILFSMKSRELDEYSNRISEYYMLMAGMILGMFLMVSSTNLLLMYLAFEMTSISSYVLVGFTKKSDKSSEASMKYIIYGAVASGIMIYGISLLVGLTGATDIYAVNMALAGDLNQPLLLTISIIMIIAGLGFKLALVPFHFWAPDVYEGAPITITAYLSVASKIAALAMTIRFFRISFSDLSVADDGAIWSMLDVLNWNVILAVLAALAMVVGNLTALRQDNIKRMLAYSSIAHAGYIMMGFVILTNEGLSAIMIYVFVYLFMNLGAFYVAMLFSNQTGTESIEKYKGLGHRAPLMGVSMTVFLVALTGFPPTAGFIAKLYIFGAAISAGWFWLVLIAGITTVVSLFYYIRVVRNMFFYKPEEGAEKLEFDAGTKIILLLLLIPTLLFGVYFTPIFEMARESVQMFGM